MENRKALDQFLARVQNRAFQMARMATGSEQDALDLVQEAMMSLVKSYADRSEAEWPRLFYKVLQNRIYDHYRRSAVKQRIFGWLPWHKEEDAADEVDPIQHAADEKAVTPERALQLGQATDNLVEAVSALPIRQQQTFLLRLWEGMSVAETAEAMGISEGSVKTHYSRALANLRGELKQVW